MNQFTPGIGWHVGKGIAGHTSENRVSCATHMSHGLVSAFQQAPGKYEIAHRVAVSLLQGLDVVRINRHYGSAPIDSSRSVLRRVRRLDLSQQRPDRSLELEPDRPGFLAGRPRNDQRDQLRAKRLS
jgi:hypothetical protein